MSKGDLMAVQSQTNIDTVMEDEDADLHSYETYVPVSTTEATSSRRRRKKVTIQDLTDQLLEYIFSFLTFKQRTRCESVCKRWNKLSLDCPQLGLCHESNNQCRKLDDGVLVSVLKRRGPACKKFILSCNTKLTCQSLTKIGQLCPHLEEFDLGCKTREQTECLKTLAPTCPNLKSLRIKNFGAATVDTTKSCNEGLLSVAQNCDGLEHLHVSNVISVSPDWLDIINPYLRTFDLRASSITSEGMRCLMRRCHTIQIMTMDYCNVSDQYALVQFLKYFRLTVRGLRMRNLYYVPNVQWIEVLPSLPHLEVVELYRCGRVDDELLAAMVDKCVKIRYLDICSSAVTDAGILSLQKLPNLKQVKVSSDVARGLENLASKGILKRAWVVGRSPGVEEVCRNLSTRLRNRCRFVPESMKEISAAHGAGE